MTEKRKWIWLILSATIVLFVFSNSMESVTDSREKSIAFAEFLAHLFGWKGVWDISKYDHLVRKAAHFTEFALCGFAMAMLLNEWQCKKSKMRFVLSLCLLTVVASVDETIQLFFDRGASVWDVLLDVVGGACGIACVWLVCYLSQRKKKQRNGA